jgi:hypothetical protein
VRQARLARPDLPKFAANKCEKGTDGKNRTRVQRALALFVFWSLGGVARIFTSQVEGATYLNCAGNRSKTTEPQAGIGRDEHAAHAAYAVARANATTLIKRNACGHEGPAISLAQAIDLALV